jgi:phosphoglycolate phosphatase
MQEAFDEIRHPLPDRQQIMSIVGLSLPQAFDVLIPGGDHALNEKACNAYKASFSNARIHQEKSALFDGMMDLLTSLRDIPDTYLGVATRKSRRGLDALLTGYDIQDWFITQQVADNHPSKPHPSMIMSAMEKLGVLSDQTVMIGDTSFDMEMAVAADVF